PLFQAGELVSALPVAALAPGASATVAFDWNVIGKAGVQTISAVVDSGDIVREFNEFNNRSNTSITIPEVVHNLYTAESAYSSGDIVHIEGVTTNLSADKTFAPVQVATTVSGPMGNEVFSNMASMELLPASVVSVSSLWDTKGMALGDYTITQSIVSGQQVLASTWKTITLNNTVPSCQVLAPLSGQTISGRYQVSWQAQDVDGNLLVIDVAYSHDTGSTWVYESTNRANDGVYSWDTSSLPDGSTYKIKIIAKDGKAAASCESGVFATLNTGTLKINSQPDGAKAYIDGNYAYSGTYYGTTGIYISQIRAGKHTLRLTYPGYIDHYQLIDIMPGAEIQVMADLKPFVSVSYGNGVKVTSQGLPIDAGTYSVPVVVDLNMDGKKDLIVGNSVGQVLYYENTGADNSPLFNADPVVIFSGGQNISPFVIDWDNDGRADIIAGGINGEVLLYKNSSQGSLSFEPGATIAGVSSSAIPFVIDWNDDNKKDLVIGSGDGTLNIYINQGTDSQPAFNLNPDMTIITSISSISPFVLTDWDGNGTKDLIVGSGYGGIYVYPNQGTNASPSFGAGQSLTGITGPINPGGSSTPFIVDFNNDGLRDLITGNINGEIDLFIASEALVPVEIDLDPDTLNKKSKGQWVTCEIELPAGFSAADVDISSLLLEGVIPAEKKPGENEDHDSDDDSDETHELKVKFDWQRLQNILSKGDKVKVTLTGRLKDGRNIRGEDYIRVRE
ncbi:MAG: VCBS repeat-containing protein, partial [Deltaproteobacteria bacterium]|nr:VCBS repeat-containing protein [Deltaproteobacteria bacterium]